MSDLVISRSKVFELEQEMFKLPQVELPVKHHFSKGIYARELFIPAGTTLTGKIHKFENLNILSQGEMSVLVDDEVVRVNAPFTVISPPGTKRVAYAHTDCVWTTIHATNEVDVVAIENEFVCNTEIEYIEFSRPALIKEN